MNNEALNRLRVPAAWALLGAVAAHMLGGVIFVMGHGSTYDATAAANFTAVGTDLLHGPLLVGLLAGAVALVATAPVKTSVNFPVVLTALIMTGFAALMGVVGVVMGFIDANESGEIADGFTSFLSVGGQLAVTVFAGLFMLRVFGDHELVPRSAPPQQGMPIGTPGFPPQTGAQQSFAPQTGGQQPFAQPGYSTGGQAAYQPQPQQDWAGQQSYGGAPAQPGAYDPNQQQTYAGDPSTAYGYGAQQPAAQQPYAADPIAGQGYSPDPMGQSAYGAQQAYGTDPTAGQGYFPDPAGQPAYGAGSGGQQSYTPTWQGQGADAYPQAGTGQDPYQTAQPAYGQTGGQTSYGQGAYGQGYQPGYDAYGQQPYATGSGGQSVYGTGGQSAYGTGGQSAYGTGGQSAYGTGSGGQQAYAGGLPGYSTGDQQPYAAGTGGQSAYSSPYEPAQYAPQPGSEGEKAAQDAIQYGWYQQPAEQQSAEPRRDTPMEPFFTDDTATDQTAAIDPVYGTPYGQQGADGTENQGWYRDDDRR
ncbi:mediator complex subunit 15 domain-containing protein [Streptomonospora wellingtoniae]|uniref:Uncharacterized protein n=1 Tax=Streptomonospora wellingtoniae TaxID=3075544 RepID=A0ABU2KQU7_9ACTN|nr:hypothetical protein [Streptomonospora sp. DSM 45055]MDT0301586.1 hypothetical protein [Streptomonospora sp. DSM 45055]